MKLAVSSIAWENPLDTAILAMLRDAGITGIEIAPTKCWPEWRGMNIAAARAIAAQYQDSGFTIPSFQAILFAKPNLKLFGDADTRRALHDHLLRVADIAAAMGAEKLVFGAPHNRHPGDLTPEDCFNIARDFFVHLAPFYAERGVILALEPNPTAYGCQFITNSHEGRELVKAVNHPAFRLHLDAACMFLAEESGANAIRENADILCHFHASEPQLGAFDAPQAPHAANATALKDIKYPGWVVLEMRQQPDEFTVLRDSVHHFHQLYSQLYTES